MTPLLRKFAGAVVAACLSFTASVDAQTASYSYLGDACSGGRISQVGPVPFEVIGLPRIGQSFTVVTEGSANYIWGDLRRTYLRTGLSNTNIGNLALPVDLETLLPNVNICGTLYTSGEIPARMPNVFPHTMPVHFEILIPNDQNLLGVTFYQQVLSTELTLFSPQTATALSRAGVGTIGL